MANYPSELTLNWSQDWTVNEPNTQRYFISVWNVFFHWVLSALIITMPLLSRPHSQTTLWDLFILLFVNVGSCHVYPWMFKQKRLEK